MIDVERGIQVETLKHQLAIRSTCIDSSADVGDFLAGECLWDTRQRLPYTRIAGGYLGLPPGEASDGSAVDVRRAAPGLQPPQFNSPSLPRAIHRSR